MKHIHARTQPPLKQLQIETITEQHFSAGMWIKSGTHTGSMYDTYRIYYNIVYICTGAVHGLSENVGSGCLSRTRFFASRSQLCLSVDEREQTLLPSLGEHAAMLGAQNTLRRRRCLFLGLGPQAYAAVAVRGGAREEPSHRRETKVEASTLVLQKHFFPFASPLQFKQSRRCHDTSC